MAGGVGCCEAEVDIEIANRQRANSSGEQNLRMFSTLVAFSPQRRELCKPTASAPRLIATAVRISVLRNLYCHGVEPPPRLIIVQEKILDNDGSRIYDKTCVFRRFV